MFYDIEEPNQFCKSIEKILEKWIMDFRIFLFSTIIKNLTYDQICHEHCTYYSLSTFNKIISKIT